MTVVEKNSRGGICDWTGVDIYIYMYIYIIYTYITLINLGMAQLSLIIAC